MADDIDTVIAAWTERLDEQERVARKVGQPWSVEGCRVFDPKSVLEDIGRKRRIIEHYRSVVDAADYQPDGESALMSDGELRALELAIRTLAGATEKTDE